MKLRTAIVTTSAALILLVVSACAVQRGQESVGAYVDDTTITTSIKSSFISDKAVDASNIHVETLNGTVMLSGFAKNETEKTTAGTIAMKAKGVKSVRNEIVVRS